jgi:signal transduction histidine kinase
MKLPPLLPQLSIRRWLAVAFVTVFFVPVFMTASIVWHVLGEPQSTGDRAVERLQDDAARWTDPAWQEATRAELAAEGVDFVLRAGDDELYRSTADPLAPAGPDGPRDVDVVWVGGTDPPLVAEVYSGEADWAAGGRWLIPVVALTSFVGTIAAFAWFLGRMVVRPLAATSDAARRVAAGDLAVALPTSRVREVAQLNASFEAMSAELDASLRHEAELEQERRLFIGAIVHDLRTPLFSLRGYLDGLAQGVADTPEKRERYLAVAREKADSLERLIADLFDFTRLEYLDQTPHCEPLDLAALLGRLVEGIRPRAEAKGVRLLVEDLSVPCTVDGDAHLLTRAIENLLDNAVRFTPGGGDVRVSYRTVGQRTTVTVADSGPGIPAADLPHLFTPLYRGESSRNRRTGGAGLGLTIAKRIVEAHGGDLTAGNAPNGGAIFRVTLPAPAEPNPPGISRLEPAPAPAPSAVVPAGEAPLRGAGAGPS